MGAFLDRIVYVTDGDFVFDFVVEDSLEGGYDLVVSCQLLRPGLGGRGIHTTTPPISKRMAVGGLEEEAMVLSK